MCGDNNSRRAAGGALAVIGPSPFKTSDSGIPMKGHLAFCTTGVESSLVTHAVLHLDYFEYQPSYTGFSVTIHETGDLTKPASTSPTWATFLVATVMGDVKYYNGGISPEAVKILPERPFKIEVGDDGIIGRRVSIWTQNGTVGPLAEGIVGYN